MVLIELTCSSGVGFHSIERMVSMLGGMKEVGSARDGSVALVGGRAQEGEEVAATVLEETRRV